jgi:hypothetical protein
MSLSATVWTNRNVYGRCLNQGAVPKAATPIRDKQNMLGLSMIVWHVTTWKKLNRYMQNGGIRPPVRAWKTIREAERFSKQTGRRLIIRLKVPEDTPTLLGHKGMAVILNSVYKLDGTI